MNSERIPNHDELWPSGRVDDQWPPEIDEQWPDSYLDEDEIRGAAAQARVIVEVRPEMGLVAGNPFVYVGAGSGRFSEEFLDSLTIESARALLQLMGHAYAQTFVKLLQFKHYVPTEIVGRDPSAILEIVGRVAVGLSDGEIASEIGETEKFVQRVRLAVGRKQTGGPFKRTRGRPRKGSES
jgi:hypothetical protein